jgi:hypothetical protein
VSIVGRVYLERGELVTVLTAWKQIPKAERLDLPGLEALKTATPRNVLIRRADGTRVVRPFRGLRKPLTQPDQSTAKRKTTVQKIPTLFVRDPEDMKRVLPEVNPACKWVLDGQGTPTRKYDGTCMMLDEAGNWWARREVKPGKAAPPNFVALGTDDNTGKTVGWEPIEQSAFSKFHAEALASNSAHFGPGGFEPGTYELIGVKVNGNPERIDPDFGHQLMSHDRAEVLDVPRDPDGLRDWLIAHPQYEGIVWHHEDGRMAKLKRRDVI